MAAPISDFSLNQRGVMIGTKLYIRVIKYDPTYLHSIRFSVGQTSPFTGDILNGSGEDIYGDTYVEWDTDDDNTKNGIYNTMPNSNDVSCRIILTTYNSSGDPIGSKTETITLTAGADAYPYVDIHSGGVSAYDTNDTIRNIVGENKIVRYLSNLRLTINATSPYHSPITSVTVGGAHGTLSSITDEKYSYNVMFNNVSFDASEKLPCTVTDSRGNSSTIFVSIANDQSITFIDYTPVSVSASAVRNGSGVDVTITGNCVLIPKRTGGNTVLYSRIQIRESGTSSWGAPFVYSYSSVSGGTFNVTESPSITLDQSKPYDIRVAVNDGTGALGDDSRVLSVAQQTITLTSVDPIFDWGKDDFRFNVPVTLRAIPRAGDDGLYDAINRKFLEEYITDLGGQSVNIYWSSDGDDSNDGLTNLTPVKTITKIRDIHNKYRNGTMNVIMSWGYWPTLPTSGSVEFHNSTVKITFDSSQQSSATGKIDLSVGSFALKFYDCDVTFNRINFTDVTTNNSIVFSNCRVTWDADIHSTCNTAAVWCSDGFIAIGRGRSVSLNHTPTSPNSDNTALFQVVGSTVLVGKSAFINGTVYRLFDGRETTGNVANAIILPTSASYGNLSRTAASGTFAKYANVLTPGGSASSNI